MTGYVARFKTLLAINSPTPQTDKSDKRASVSFVSDQGSHVCGDEAAIEERGGLAAGRVPAAYLDAWARLQCQRPLSVAEDECRQAIEDAGRFLDAWGADAATMRWTAAELFDVPRNSPSGDLIWQ
jgi:hypothetical protein